MDGSTVVSMGRCTLCLQRHKMEIMSISNESLPERGIFLRSIPTWISTAIELVRINLSSELFFITAKQK